MPEQAARHAPARIADPVADPWHLRVSSQPPPRTARGGLDGETLQIGISTHFYAAESEQDAADVFEHYRSYLHPDTNNGRGFVVDRATFDAARRRDGALMIGSAEQLTEKILDAQTELGITRFIGQFDWGGLPTARVHESIARMATEIAPTVRAAVSATVT